MLANIRTLITPLIKMVEYIPLIYTNLKWSSTIVRINGEGVDGLGRCKTNR